MVNKAVHPSYARLLEVAAQNQVDELDIPAEMGMPASRVGMWRYRGVSNKGVIKAAEVFNTSARYITSGGEPVTKTSSHHMAIIGEALASIKDKQIRFQAWHEALNAIAKYAPAQESQPVDTLPEPEPKRKRRARHQP